MNMTRSRIVLLGGMALYLAVMAFAGGVAAERIRFDRQRAAVLASHDLAVRQWHEFRMAGERRADTAPSSDALGPVVW